MKIFAPALLLFIALAMHLPAQAAPTTTQTDDVREAVFRALLVRAHALMPDAKVYILENNEHHPPEWGNAGDFNPSPDLLRRFAGNAPPVVSLSQSISESSPEGIWHGIDKNRHGPVLRIVSLQQRSDTSVEAETFIDAGLPRPVVSVPYRAEFQEGRWIVREDVPKEWWQAIHEGDIREAVLRYELAQGIYGVKPGKTPSYLTFGGYTEALIVDPSDAFIDRFAKGSVQLRKASECPKNDGHSRWLMFGIQDVRWISDNEAEVDGGGTHSQSMSADSILYEVTRSGNGWKVQPTAEISI